MKVLVVDDERVARSRLSRMLRAFGDVAAIAEARGGEDALKKIETLAPDVVLLDIQMPGLDGLSVALRAAHLAKPPHIVFVTAHDQYAVRAFEANAIDYVLKPVEAERLKAALTKSARLRSLQDHERLERIVQDLLRERGLHRIVARSGQSTRIVDAHDVSAIQAKDGYAVFHYGGHEFVLDESISELERQLGPVGFVRAHRSELINSNRVVALLREGEAMIVEFVDGQRATVSRRELARVKARLGIR